MKNTYKTKIKTLFAGLLLFVAASVSAQCSANYSYTLGANGTVNFKSTSTTTTSSTYYFWQYGGSWVGTGANFNYTFTSNGNKTVCLQIVDSTISCFNTKCDTVHITNVSSGTTTACNPTVMYTLSKDTSQALTWSAYPLYPSNVTGASWSWGDGSSSTGLYPSHTFSAAGTYSTCVTISVSCGTVTASYCYVGSIFKSAGGNESNAMITLNVKQAKATGIKSLSSMANQINIYPNPNNGFFNVDLGEVSKDSKETKVYIYNMLGEQVYSQIISSDAKQNINVSHLNNGTYFVKLLNDNTVTSKKIAIQK